MNQHLAVADEVVALASDLEVVDPSRPRLPVDQLDPAQAALRVENLVSDFQRGDGDLALAVDEEGVLVGGLEALAADLEDPDGLDFPREGGDFAEDLLAGPFIDRPYQIADFDFLDRLRTRGLTPAEAWDGASEPGSRGKPKRFEGWHGVLAGYYLEE